MLRITCALLALVMATVSCGQHKSSSNKGSDFPRRIGSGEDGVASTHVGSMTFVDGAATADLTMDLSRPYRPGEAGTSACYANPEATLPLGRAVCAADQQNISEITAANVQFVCAGRLDDGAAKPNRLSLLNCSSAVIVAYLFEPALHLKVAE